MAYNESDVDAMLARMPDREAAQRNQERLAQPNPSNLAAWIAKHGVCPNCGRDVKEGVCPHCSGRIDRTMDSHGHYEAEAVKPSENGTGRAKRGNPEARIVQAIRKALIEAGYRVYKINQRWIPGETHFANDAGIPDLLVTRRAYPGMPCLPFFVGMEVKVPGGTVTIEQARGAMDGYLFVVEDEEEALEIMATIERRIER